MLIRISFLTVEYDPNSWKNTGIGLKLVESVTKWASSGPSTFSKQEA